MDDMHEWRNRIERLEQASRASEQARQAAERHLWCWKVAMLLLVVASVVLIAPKTSTAAPPSTGNIVDRVTALEKAVATLQTTVTTQGNQIADLQTKVTDQGNQISGLQTLVSGQGNQISTLQSDLVAETAERKDADAALQQVDQALQTALAPLFALVAPSPNGLPYLERVGNDLIITGANLHIHNGMGQTDQTNGLGNVIIGYNEAQTGQSSDRRGSHNLVVGRDNGWGITSSGGIVAGLSNRIDGPATSVLGGSLNSAVGPFSTVSGGYVNLADGANASISGGSGVVVTAPFGWAAGNDPGATTYSGNFRFP